MEMSFTPYTTVHTNARGYYAVYIELAPHGEEQVSDSAPVEEEYIHAKRTAVDMARRYGCTFRVPIHG